jgi:hypothetical protein
MRRDLALVHWLTRIANKSYLFQHTCFHPMSIPHSTQPVLARRMARTDDSEHDQRHVRLLPCCYNAQPVGVFDVPAGRETLTPTGPGFMQLKRTNQCRGLTVSRPLQQPLHRLSHFSNHAPRSSLPVLEGRGQLRQSRCMSTTGWHAFFLVESTTCLCQSAPSKRSTKPLINLKSVSLRPTNLKMAT